MSLINVAFITNYLVVCLSKLNYNDVKNCSQWKESIKKNNLDVRLIFGLYEKTYLAADCEISERRYFGEDYLAKPPKIFKDKGKAGYRIC